MGQGTHMAFSHWLLGVRVGLALVALVASGCAAGGSSSDGTSGPGGSDVGSTSSSGGGKGGQGGQGGQGGMAGAGGQGGMAGAGGQGGQGGQGSGTVDLCVLNQGLPQDPCFMPPELDFGTVAPGTQEMRLFRIDNNTKSDLMFKSVSVGSPDFKITSVRYEVDPGNPTNLLRVEQPLPVARAPGKSLYFEVDFTAGSAAGPLPASDVTVNVTVFGQQPEDIVVPMVGQTAGCPPGKAACDADPTNGCETDTNTSAQHCGACGKACTTQNGSGACQAGQCVIASCNVGFELRRRRRERLRDQRAQRRRALRLVQRQLHEGQHHDLLQRR